MTDAAGAPAINAPATNAPAAGAIDPKLIVPFVNAVRSVFSTMAGVQTSVQRPYLKLAAPRSGGPEHHVASTILFSGELIGSLVLCFEREPAQKLVTAFVGVPMDPHGEDFADAVG